MCKLKLGVLMLIKILGGCLLKWVNSCFLIFKIVGKWVSILISFMIDKVFILNKLWKFCVCMCVLLIFLIIVFGYWCFSCVIMLVVKILFDGFFVIIVIWNGFVILVNNVVFSCF